MSQFLSPWINKRTDEYGGIIEILETGFDFLALARALIQDSNFRLKLEANELEKSECTRCNECALEMDRWGARCVLND